MSLELSERWGTADLQRQLQKVEPGVQVEVVASTGSTNTALLEQASALRSRGDAGEHGQPFTTRLLVAEQQTQGRGRQGRVWHATPGASLTFSLALTLAPQDWSGLSLAVGVALAEALEPVLPSATAMAMVEENSPQMGLTPDSPHIGRPSSSPRIRLKWPNDLWLRDETAEAGGRKLGGVLIETASWSTIAGARVCVIGVGLNIQPQHVEGAASGVACLQELQPDTTGPAVLAQVAGPLLAAVRGFEREGFASVATRFAQRDLLRGQTVTTTLQGLPEGVAMGVDATGALLVRAPDGRQHAVVGGEVSVKPMPGRAT